MNKLNEQATSLIKQGYEVERKHYQSVRLRKNNHVIVLINCFGKVEQHNINLV